jgi:hypothetical protein
MFFVKCPNIFSHSDVGYTCITLFDFLKNFGYINLKQLKLDKNMSFLGETTRSKYNHMLVGSSVISRVEIN